MLFITRNGWVQDSDINDYLRPFGATFSDLTGALFEAKYYKKTTNKKTGKEEKHFHTQVSLNSDMKPQIHYIKCYVTVKLAKNQPSFSWSSFASRVWSIDKKDTTLVEKAVEQIKSIYMDVEEILDEKIDQTKKQFIQNACEQACKHVPSLDNQLSCERKPKEQIPSVSKAFMENVLVGIGINKSKVEVYYKHNKPEESLELRVNEISKDIKSRWSTFTQYVTVQNLFLLYMNDEDPTLFEENGIIEVNEMNAYNFLESCLNGELSLTETEPPLSHVLDGNNWCRTITPSNRFKEGNGNKFVNALSDLCAKQRMIFGVPNTPHLRDYGLINTWLTNLYNAEAEKREKNFESRHAGIFPFDDPFHTAHTQSHHCLLSDTWQSTRLRCLLLTQLWSISRWNEMSQWKICDLMMTTFSPEGDCSLKQAIVPLFFLQTKYKAAKTKKKIKPQKKLLVRRRCPSLCPQSALAMFLFERYILDGEDEVNVLSPNDQWYGIKIFREKLDKFKVPSSSSLREERMKLGAETETAISGLVNHYGRQLGSFIGKACVAKLSGYLSKETFWMPRAMASTKNFLALNPKYEPFFDAFLKLTSLQNVTDEATKLRAIGDHTPAMVLKALTQLKEVFYQDLGYYIKHYPNLRMWKSLLFTKHADALEAWLLYVNSFEEMEMLGQALQDTSTIGHHEYRLLREEIKVNNAKLNKLMLSLEPKDPQLATATHYEH
eukprot:g9019.t1